MNQEKRMALVGASTRFLGAVIVALGGAVMASAHHAAAQPAGFPNLDNFTPVPLDDYLAPLAHGAVVVNFSAPNNLVCDFYGGPPPPPGPLQNIDCEGDMPGMQNVPFFEGGRPGPNDCVFGVTKATGLNRGWGPLTEGQS
jgi:hypothetical protein